MSHLINHRTGTTRRQATNGATNMTIDRSETARCLAKAIAFKQCGKDAEAAAWARKLVTALECAEILN